VNLIYITSDWLEKLQQAGLRPYLWLEGLILFGVSMSPYAYVLKGIEFDGWNSLPACGSRIAFFGMED
jgi:hypothetical protein